MKEQWKAGEIITLGHYQQSKAGSSEPIEWKILKVEGCKALVTSLYALDAQPWHDDGSAKDWKAPEPNAAGTINLAAFIRPGFKEASWAKSTLRAWLNRDFSEAAFSAKERDCLLTMDDTLDRVSLLGLDEHINDAALFPTDASTGCRATPYAASLYSDDIEADRQERATKPLPPRASYWLKNKGVVIHGDQMEGVMGVTCGRMDLAGRLAVRPVLLLNLVRYEALLTGFDVHGSLFSKLRAVNMKITHRFDDVEQKGSVRIDWQNHRAFVDGVGAPDLHLELVLGDRVDQKTEQAFAMCLSMAVGGNAKAQNSIGTQYWFGRVVAQDYAEAARWNRYAANQGLPEAMVDLADAYFNAKGVERNVETAFAWCLKAAEKEFPLGMLNAGKCYANGWGTERNEDEAIKWYARALKAGNPEAGALLHQLITRKTEQ